MDHVNDSRRISKREVVIHSITYCPRGQLHKVDIILAKESSGICFIQLYSHFKQQTNVVKSYETTDGQDTAMDLGFYCAGELRAQELVLRDVFHFLQEINLNREQFVQTR